MPIQKRDQISAVKTTARLLGATPAEIDADPDQTAEAAGDDSAGGAGAFPRPLEQYSLAGRQGARPCPPDSAGTPNGSAAARVGSAFRSALPESGGGPAGHGAVFECEKRSTRRGDGSRISRPITRRSSATGSGPSQSRPGMRSSGPGTPAGARSSGWPDIEIPREIRREVYVLPWSDFPPSLKADVDAFLLRLSGADLSEDGPARPARAATLEDQGKAVARGGVCARPQRSRAPSRFVRWPTSSPSSVSS